MFHEAAERGGPSHPARLNMAHPWALETRPERAVKEFFTSHTSALSYKAAAIL